MGAERIIIASVATAAKYSGNTIDGVSSTPYPLVDKQDAFGRDIVTELILKDQDENLITFKEAVVNITRSREIVSTPVLNGKGTVKEMITNGDFDLTITLAVVSNTEDGEFEMESVKAYDVYPYKAVKRLRRMLDRQERLNIVSDFLKLFDLDGGEFGIVVKRYTVHQDTHLNRQVFEIQAVSDYDYELLIKE